MASSSSNSAQILKMKRQIAEIQLQILEAEKAEGINTTREASEPKLSKEAYEPKRSGEPSQAHQGRESGLVYPPNSNKAAVDSSNKKIIPLDRNRKERARPNTCLVVEPYVQPTSVLAQSQEATFDLVDQLAQETDQVQIANPADSRPPKPLKPSNEKTRDFNPTQIKPWKPSTPVSKDQLDILTSAFNHIRQGTGNPKPIRKVEAEFSRLNRLIKNSVESEQRKRISEFDPITYNEEIDLSYFLTEAPIKCELFYNNIVPTFFRLLERWNHLYKTINSAADWEEVLRKCYNSTDVQAFKDKAQIWRSPAGGKQILIKAEISSDIFAELIEAGFIHSIILDENSVRMANKAHPTVQEFIEFLDRTRLYRSTINRDTLYGIRLMTAPPMYEYIHWKTVGEFLVGKPRIFPSIIYMQEVANIAKSVDYTKPELVDINDDNYRERALRLQQLEDASADLSKHYVWKDDKRILCHAENGHLRSHLAIQFATGNQGVLCPKLEEHLQPAKRQKTTSKDKTNLTLH
ncbi:unnamed protein product [Camellia sinensis]